MLLLFRKKELERIIRMSGGYLKDLGNILNYINSFNDDAVLQINSEGNFTISEYDGPAFSIGTVEDEGKVNDYQEDAVQCCANCDHIEEHEHDHGYPYCDVNGGDVKYWGICSKWTDVD